MNPPTNPPSNPPPPPQLSHCNALFLQVHPLLLYSLLPSCQVQLKISSSSPTPFPLCILGLLCYHIATALQLFRCSHLPFVSPHICFDWRRGARTYVEDQSRMLRQVSFQTLVLLLSNLFWDLFIFQSLMDLHQQLYSTVFSPLHSKLAPPLL